MDGGGAPEGPSTHAVLLELSVELNGGGSVASVDVEMERQCCKHGHPGSVLVSVAIAEKKTGLTLLRLFLCLFVGDRKVSALFRYQIDHALGRSALQRSVRPFGGSDAREKFDPGGGSLNRRIVDKRERCRMILQERTALRGRRWKDTGERGRV